MIKFNEFESTGKKKQNRLKKVKNNDLVIDRRKKEIQKRMNVYVNGSSSFSNDVGSAFEKKQTNLEVKLTPEWIIDKFSLLRSADGNGNVKFYADDSTLPWLELSIISLGIDYKKDEIVIDAENNEVITSFEFLLDDIKYKCPVLYEVMFDLNAKELIHR
jgi:uncharacterized beta-barrel protein YwiB (DUF1934 family)